MTIDETGNSGQIPTNLRLLLLLEEVAKVGVPVTPSVVNEVLGLPKPTIHLRVQAVGTCVDVLQTGAVLPQTLPSANHLGGRNSRVEVYTAPAPPCLTTPRG